METAKRNTKGQFKKGNTFAKKSVDGAVYTVASTNLRNEISEDIKTTEPIKVKYKEEDYNVIQFGTNNLLFDSLAEYIRNSTTARAVLSNKAKFTASKSIDTTNEDLNLCNPKYRIRELMLRSALDYGYHGNSFIEIVKIGGTITAYHKDATKCRLTDKNSIAIHPSWKTFEDDKNSLIIIPLYPQFMEDEQISFDENNKEVKTKVERSMIHSYDYESGFDYYGLPLCVGCLDSIKTENEIGLWNYNRIIRGFRRDGIYELIGNFKDEIEANAKKKEIEDRFNDKDNNHGIEVIIKSPGAEKSTYTALSEESEGEWIELDKNCVNKIITGCNWFPSLSGIKIAGELGNQQNFEHELNLALDIVSDIRELILTPLLKVFDENLTYDKIKFQEFGQINKEDANNDSKNK